LTHFSHLKTFILVLSYPVLITSW